MISRPQVLLTSLVLGVSAVALPLTSTLAASTDLSVAVPPGTKLVIADDARETELLLKLSGEQEKLAASVSYASFSSGPLRAEAIRSGSAQVGIVGDVPPILAQFSGANLLIVGVVASTGPSLLLATSPTSGIKAVADLKGKRVAINDGTAQHAVVLRNLKSAGLGATDIVSVNLGVAEFADALRAGQIDAAVLKQPDRARYLSSASKQGAIALDGAPDANPGYAYAYASKPALEDPAQSAAIRDFIVHWYRAHEWRNANPDKWMQSYLVENQRLKPADAEQVIKSRGEVAFPGLTKEVIATQQKTIDLLQAAGVFKGKVLNAEDEYDLRYAPLTARSETVNR